MVSKIGGSEIRGRKEGQVEFKRKKEKYVLDGDEWIKKGMKIKGRKERQVEFKGIKREKNALDGDGWIKKEAKETLKKWKKEGKKAEIGSEKKREGKT